MSDPLLTRPSKSDAPILPLGCKINIEFFIINCHKYIICFKNLMYACTRYVYMFLFCGNPIYGVSKHVICFSECFCLDISLSEVSVSSPEAGHSSSEGTRLFMSEGCCKGTEAQHRILYFLLIFENKTIN